MNRGFTLVEVMMGVVLISAMSLGIGYVSSVISSQQKTEKATAMLSQKRIDIQNAVSSDAAWSRTISLNGPASHLNCMTNAAGCVGQTGPYDFSLYDAQGNAIYTSGTGNGFNLDGTLCTVAPCAFQLSLQWTPSCAVSDPNCNYPFIKVTGTYTTPNFSGGLNAKKYDIGLFRQAITTSPCPDTAPSCGSELAVCESTGWACVPEIPPYCTGAVSWVDSSTSVGGCSAVIAAPGILHNTVGPAVTNTAASMVGSASFLCLPGALPTPLVVQPGATCAPAPINGLCGGANGNTYVSASDAMAAGLCLAGPASPGSLSDPGPWAWNCLGQYGGSNSPGCSSSIPAATTTTTTIPIAAAPNCMVKFTYTGAGIGGSANTFCYTTGSCTVMAPTLPGENFGPGGWGVGTLSVTTVHCTGTPPPCPNFVINAANNNSMRDSMMAATTAAGCSP